MASTPARPYDRSRVDSVNSLLLRYGLAIVAVAVAVGVTLIIRRSTGSPTFFSLYVAIFVSIWFAGRGPGLLALVLASACLHFSFFASPDVMKLSSEELPTLAAFVLCGVTAAMLSAQRDRTEDTLRRAGQRLELAVQDRTAELHRTNEALRIQIAERKRMEDALRASEQRWHRVFDSSAIPMALADGDRRIVAVNSACERLLGYTPDEFMAMSALDFKYGDDRDVSARMLQELEQGVRREFQGELRFRRKDGSPIWVNVSVSYIPATETTPALFPAVIEDITQRKQAELERQRLASIVEQAGDFMGIADLAGTPIYLNEAGMRMVGLDLDALRTRRGTHYLFREDRPFMNQVVWPAIMKNGSWSGELRFRHFKTEAAVPILYDAFRIDDPETGRPANIGFVCRDITERKLAEAALRASEERWRSVFQTASVGIATSDANRRILSANPALQRMLGYTEAELQKLGWADLTHEDDEVLTAGWVTGLAQGREQAFQVEKRYRRKDGEFVWVSVNASYVPATEVSTDFFASVMVDITGRKCAEEALRQARDELARVARATTIGELGASIAHEINQPLAAIVASGNACRRWLENGQNLARAKESLNRIIADANRASEVVNRIRALTRRRAPEHLELAINDVVEEVLTFARNELQANDISIRRDLHRDVPRIMGDRVQLLQVILNLVMNGIDAMTAVEDRRRVLSVKSRLDDHGGLRVTVQDSGCGLDPQDADRIFTAFFTTKPEGMGMGLAISTSIIEAHGGRLWASPADPQGTAFHFTLPAAGGSGP
jgi:PAS domain S-box-containing protein